MLVTAGVIPSLCQGWATNLEAGVVVTPEIVLVKFRASPTWILGCFSTNFKPAMKQMQVFKLTVALNLHMASQEMVLGVLKHMVILLSREARQRRI